MGITKTFTGTSSTYTDGGWTGKLHTVQLTGLKIDGETVYHYSCDSSSEFTFKAAPPPSSFPFTIAAVADLGQECAHTKSGGEGCPNATFSALTKAATNNEFGLLLHAGDIAYTSGQQGIWDTYHRELEPVASRVPYAVCPGNHEAHYNFSAFRHRYRMPGEAQRTQNLWYSFDWAGMHVVSLSSEHDFAPGSAQYAWLVADLAAAAAPAQRARVPWLVVMAHRPIYCSTDDYYDCKVRGPTKMGPALEPLFERHGVDLGLFGHLHNYERSWPTSANGTVQQRSYALPTAPVHVVIGGAGDDEGLTDSWEHPAPGWSAFRAGAADTMGFARLTFRSAAEMEFEWVLAKNSTVLDAFTLTKRR